MAVISKDLGAVTAYAAAVEGGYTGTKEEFETLMASYATVAEEAAESAESASASATSASGSAQTATQKASEASTSATQAGASATSASQSAQTATTKASEASASASTASTKASEASTSASTASTKASEASASATAAQTAQTAAEGSATTAQTAARTATTKAAEAAESARTLAIDPTLTQSGQAADSKVVGDEITGLKEDFTEISKAHNAVVETVSGKSDSGDIPFEIGSITIGSSGWTFSSSTKRARICEGYTITMRPGDKIGFKSYSNLRFYVGWQRENGTYGTMGRWLQEDFQAGEWGKATICISNTPEVAISDITTITDLFFIERLNSIETSLIKHNVKGINHKGYSFVAPENTLPAYALSKKMGYEYVECDVQFTSDDVPVLLHNSSINATARNADGSAISTTVNVGETAYNDLLQYDFGIWKSDAYAGTKIPTFEEFIRFCKYSGLKPYCEIKGDTMTEARIKLLTDIVIKNGMQKSVTWISFAVNALNYVKNNIPTARLGIISATLTALVISSHHALKSDSNDVFVNLEKSAVTDENVATLISEGIETETYTVDIFSATKNVNPYITGITTNCVDVVGALASYAETLA